MRFKLRRPTIEQLESRRLLALNPTGHEQEMLQLFNRFRTDPQGEFARMFSSATPLRARDSSIQAELDRHSVNGAMLQSEWNAIAPAQPLIWNEALYNFAAAHNAEMIRQNNGFHSNTQVRQNAIRAAGIDFALEGELVSLRSSNPMQGYAVYAVNWGTNPATGRIKGGMQDPRGHRTLLVTPGFDQVGHRFTATSASFLTPGVNTVVLVDNRNLPLMVTGAVFEDKNNNGWYENGEGRGSVKIDFEKTTGEKFATTSLSAGGYQIALPAGTYKVRATGGGMAHAVVQTITVSDKSLWRNLIYKPTDPPPDAHEPNESLATATALTGQSPSISNLSLHRDSDVDFFRFTPLGTAMATFEVNFTHSQGNVDLELQDSFGNLLARSAGTGNKETITHQVEASKIYYVKVYGKANSKYDLKITGPESIPLDSKEPNNTRETASLMTGHSPTVQNLSLHSNLDVDFFKYVAVANGSAKFDVEFTHANGNVDLQLLDAQGAVLATSAGNGNVESITRTVQRGATYYLRVYGGPNRSYLVRVSGPNLRPPIAQNDRAMAANNLPAVTMSILSNDQNPDGTISELVPTLASNAPAAFTLNANRTLTYRAPTAFTGVHRSTYTVTNADNLTSQPANIEVLVIDYARPTPWRHPSRSNDVNDDGRVSSVDALLIINELNTDRNRTLPLSGASTLLGFVDTNGDGRLSALDALLVINQLNAGSQGAGEGEHPNSASRTLVTASNLNTGPLRTDESTFHYRDTGLYRDAALSQIMLADDLQDEDRRSRRLT